MYIQHCTCTSYLHCSKGSREGIHPVVESAGCGVVHIDKVWSVRQGALLEHIAATTTADERTGGREGGDRVKKGHRNDTGGREGEEKKEGEEMTITHMYMYMTD